MGNNINVKDHIKFLILIESKISFEGLINTYQPIIFRTKHGFKYSFYQDLLIFYKIIKVNNKPLEEIYSNLKLNIVALKFSLWIKEMYRNKFYKVIIMKLLIYIKENFYFQI